MTWMARAIGLQAFCTAIAIALTGVGFISSVRAQTPTNGLIMLIEFEKIDGIRHWERELDQRGLTALVQAQNNVLKEYPDDFIRLAAKGYTISGIDAEKPFWDVAYDEQFARMRAVKESVERITHKANARVQQPVFRLRQTPCAPPTCSVSNMCSVAAPPERWPPSMRRVNIRPR